MFCLYICKKNNIMINNWFNPTNLSNEEYTFEIEKPKYLKDIPDLHRSKAVIFGLNQQISNSVRKSLSLFQNHFKELHIVDLGDVKNTNPEFILQAVSEIIDGNIIPIIIGGDDKFFEKLNSYLVTIKREGNNCIISNKIDKSNSSGCNNSFTMAYQRHLCEEEELNKEETILHSLSLGKMRSKRALWEPLLRDVTILNFKFDSIRRSEVDYNGSIPTGLTSEEACQLMRYTGESESLKTIILNLGIDEISTSQSLIAAELIWYSLEGINCRLQGDRIPNPETQEFIVDMQESEGELSFIRNNHTNKWWFKVDSRYIPCSEEEYRETVDNILPDRLMNKIK